MRCTGLKRPLRATARQKSWSFCARAVSAAAHPAIGQRDRVHGAGAGAGYRLDVEPPVLEQPVEHAPGERAVRAAALQRDIDGFLGRRCRSLPLIVMTLVHRVAPCHRRRRLEVLRRKDRIHCAVQPPSTEICVPLIWAAASEHRNSDRRGDLLDGDELLGRLPVQHDFADDRLAVHVVRLHLVGDLRFDQRQSARSPDRPRCR